jgi:cell pole-organizing protein PopZ
MAAPETNAEPTMEEILASIRRIISEEDAPAAKPAGDVLELTQRAPEPAPPPMPAPQPAPVAAAPQPAPAPAPTPPKIAMPDLAGDDDLEVLDEAPIAAPVAARAPAPRAPIDTSSLIDEEGLVGAPQLEEAIGALGRLAASMPISDNPSRTIEGVVREMLKPMLKEWLDSNLPRIVEEKVEAEITRLARAVRRAR